ncbi:hypothetical protein PIIN_09716, partial [Serendipita indica DSM 11827]
TQGIIYGRREQLEDEEDEEDEEEGLEEEIEEVEQDGLRGLALRKEAHPSDQSPDKLLQNRVASDRRGGSYRPKSHRTPGSVDLTDAHAGPQAQLSP